MTLGIEIATQFFINSVALGLMYGLVGLGLSLVYGVMRVVNVAHGAVYMLGGFIIFTVTSQFLQLPVVVGLGLTVVALFALGMLIELLAVERVNGDPNSSMLITIGLAILLEAIALIVWGGIYKSVRPIAVGSLQIFDYYIQFQQLIGAIAAILIAAAISQYLTRSKTGRAIQMLAFDRETATILGVNAAGIGMLTFGIGSASAGVAGAFLSSLYTLYPDVGWSFLVIAFAVVVLGGIGSIKGTMVGGIIYAFSQTLTGYYFPRYETLAALVLLIVMLLVRPSGLFGQAYAERA